jgi:hypothetical protein
LAAATRRAAAVVGVDSGPPHRAAGLSAGDPTGGAAPTEAVCEVRPLCRAGTCPLAPSHAGPRQIARILFGQPCI